MDTDLSNHVILPREDFVELQQAAWDQPDVPFKKQMQNTANMTLFMFGAAAAVGFGTLTWAKAVDWLEERQLKRKMREAEIYNQKAAPKKL